MRGIWALPWHSLGSLDLTRGTFNNKVCKIGQNNSFFSLNLSSGDINSNTWAITKKCSQKEMPKAQKNAYTRLWWVLFHSRFIKENPHWWVGACCNVTKHREFKTKENIYNFILLRQTIKNSFKLFNILFLCTVQLNLWGDLLINLS